MSFTELQSLISDAKASEYDNLEVLSEAEWLEAEASEQAAEDDYLIKAFYNEEY